MSDLMSKSMNHYMLKLESGLRGILSTGSSFSTSTGRVQIRLKPPPKKQKILKRSLKSIQTLRLQRQTLLLTLLHLRTRIHLSATWPVIPHRHQTIATSVPTSKSVRKPSQELCSGPAGPGEKWLWRSCSPRPKMRRRQSTRIHQVTSPQERKR